MGWFSIPWIAPRSVQDAWLIGITWVLLTVAFEFLGGHFLFGRPWKLLLADYNILAGRIWVMVLVVSLVTPVVAFTRRRYDSRRRADIHSAVMRRQSWTQ